MEEEVPEIVKSLSKKLPHFQDGRIDYSNADRAPVVVVFLRYEDEILLLKRSEKVNTRKGGWGVVAGYLDELEPVIQKALKEVREETGITEKEISSIYEGKVYDFEHDGVRFFSHPVLMNLKKKPYVQLSWEHTDYKWTNIENVKEYLPSNAIEELRAVISDDRE